MVLSRIKLVIFFEDSYRSWSHYLTWIKPLLFFLPLTPHLLERKNWKFVQIFLEFLLKNLAQDWPIKWRWHVVKRSWSHWPLLLSFSFFSFFIFILFYFIFIFHFFFLFYLGFQPSHVILEKPWQKLFMGGCLSILLKGLTLQFAKRETLYSSGSWTFSVLRTSKYVFKIFLTYSGSCSVYWPSFQLNRSILSSNFASTMQTKDFNSSSINISLNWSKKSTHKKA